MASVGRKIFVAISLGAVGLLGGATAYIQTIDWNQYKPLITRTVEAESGLRLDISGDMSLNLFPRPALSANDLRIMKADGLNPNAPVRNLASADQLDIVVALGPLLRGQIAPSDIQVSNLKAEIELKDGMGSLLAAAPTGGAAEGVNPFEALSSLANLSILNSQIEVQQGSRVRNLRLVELTLAADSNSGRWVANSAFQLDGASVDMDVSAQRSPNGARISLRGEGSINGGAVKMSGRVEGDDIAARLEVDAENGVNFLNAFTGVVDFPNIGRDEALPLILDMSLAYTPDEINTTVRNIRLGDTQAAAELSVTRVGDDAVISGNADIAVLAIEQLLTIETIDTAPQGSKESADDAFDRTMPRGELAINIDAIPILGGVVQQITGRLNLDGETISYSSFEGIMPGATNFLLEGQTDLESENFFEGRVEVKSGALRGAMRWLGVDDTQLAPADRLATAALKGHVVLSGNGWTLDDFSGAIDSSNFSGRLAGNFQQTAPALLDLHIDKLPVRAWMAAEANQDSAVVETTCLKISCFTPDGVEFADWRVKVGIIPAGVIDFTNVTASLSISNGTLSVSDSGASLTREGQALGRLTLHGQVNNFARGNPALNIRLTTERLALDPVKLIAYRDWTRSPVLSGSIQISGEENDLALIGNFEGRDKALTFTGEAQVQDADIRLKSLQGQFKHPNLRGLISKAGLRGRGQIAGDLTFAIASGAENSVRLGGALGAANVILTADSGKAYSYQSFVAGFFADNAVKMSISVDTPNGSVLRRRFGFSPNLVAGRLPVKLSATVHSTANKAGNFERFDVSDLNFTQGNRQISGAITVAADSMISGDLSVQGLRLPVRSKAPTDNGGGNAETSAETLTQTLQTLEAYTGTITLDVRNSVLFGQRVSAGNFEATLFDGHIRFASKSLQINDQPSAIRLDLVDSDPIVGRVAELDIDIPVLEAGAGVASLGYAAPYEGQAALKGQLFFDLDNPINSLSGEGSIMLGGGELTFMNASAVSRLTREAPGVSTFLGGLENSLRGGRSLLTNGKLQFRAEDGIVLADELVAQGPWGKIDLDGQINLRDERLRLAGNLSLNEPLDIPLIPVSYAGDISNPTAQFDTRNLLSFAQVLITNRLRNSLTGSVETAASPATRILGGALSILGQLDRIKRKTKETNEGVAEDETSPPDQY